MLKSLAEYRAPSQQGRRVLRIEPEGDVICRVDNLDHPPVVGRGYLAVLDDRSLQGDDRHEPSGWS